MPIAIKSIKDMTPHSGKFRARFLYVLDDGREVLRGPVNVLDQSEANAKLISMESDVLLSVQDQDAERAIELDLANTHGEATAKQVKLSWLKKGFRQTEAYRAYFYLKKVMPEMIALNKTNAQLAVILGTTVENVVEIKEKWLTLDVDFVTLIAYEQIQRNF